MSRPVILNVTADDTWQTLGPDQGFPQNAYTVTIQSRTAVNSYFKYAGRETYVTIKSGGSARLEGKFDPGDLQVRAGNGVVLEIEISTNIRDARR